MSGMYSDVADVMKAAEAKGQGVQKTRGCCARGSVPDDVHESHRVVRHVCQVHWMRSHDDRSVTSLDGVGAWSRLHVSHSGRALGRMFRVQRARTLPEGTLSTVQWEVTWKTVMTEIGSFMKITRSVTHLCNVGDISKEVSEQMLLRLDELGEDYQTLKAKVVS